MTLKHYVNLVLPSACAPALALLLAACASSSGSARHLVWKLEDNLIRLSVGVGEARGELLLGTAHPTTLLDPRFAAAARAGGDTAVRLRGLPALRVRPALAELHGLADGIVGADVWRGRRITLDYHRALLIIDGNAEPMSDAVHSRFDAVPAVTVTIDGVEERAIVDSANPDTILLPSSRFGEEGRRRIDLSVGNLELRELDAAVEPVSEIRLGNRVLSHFVVTIDYAAREVILWQDPR
ncbi:MAG TPA: hypothetical protein VMS56_09305 [Thermoanaerobaculia bacterium]|nr:hypothetical protein [Thermoanaerobaculia bacterium]